MYMAVIIPLWVSYLVRAYAWKIILGQEGILNGFLQWAHLIDQPVTFLLYSKWAVIIALIHIYTPFTLMPIYAVLEVDPPALKEASQDLYASRWQTFRHVVLPLSLPGVVAGCTFSFVLSMGDFIAPGLLGGNDSALMVSNLVVSLFGVAYNWPLGAAVSVVMLVLTFTLLWLANKIETAMNYTGSTGQGPGCRSRRGGHGRPGRVNATRVATAPAPTGESRALDRGSRGLRVHLSPARGRGALRLPRLEHRGLAVPALHAPLVRGPGARSRHDRGDAGQRRNSRCWRWRSRSWSECPARSRLTGSSFPERPSFAAWCFCR